MGGEFGQRREWTHEGELEWWVTELPEHAGLMRWVEDLNRFYRSEPALHEVDFSHEGFEWIDCNDAETGAITLLRKPRSGGSALVVACNFTPVPRANYVVGVPWGGEWRECLNSDARDYGGAGWGNLGGVAARPVASHGRPWSLSITLPPLAVIVLKGQTRA
jgi:1,4-alpha-glucan branching enzyme